MKSIGKNRKKVNKGFTIIEVLVCIAILSVVVIPMATIFIKATKENAKAKMKHNATVVAQNVMEEYKYLSMEDISIRHNFIDVTGTGVISREDTNSDSLFDKFVLEALSANQDGDGKYYIVGASKEKFYARVTIDPTTYASAGGINAYDLPNLSDLFDGNNIVATDEISKYDKIAVARLGSPSKEAIKKTTNVEITTKISDSTTTGVIHDYKTSVYIKCIYEYNGAKYETSSFVASKQYTNDGTIPDLYVLYDDFDTWSTVSTDKINIIHTYEKGTQLTGSYEYSPINVYFVENDRDKDELSKLRIESFTGTSINNITAEGVDVINLQTNVSYIDDTGKPVNVNKPVTSSGKTENTLYTITVEIRKGSYDGELVATMVSAKERDYAK